MNHETTSGTTGTATRVQITCPGCGRHDRVNWPSDMPVYHWKCFNCGKQFDLTHKKSH